MYLKSLAIIEKSSISLEKSSKMVEILITLLKKSLFYSGNFFKKPFYLYKSLIVILKSLNFSENDFKKPRHLYKSLTFLNKSLHFLENVFKKPQNLSICPTIMKKASICLIIILKSLEFFEKASHL
jgi:hypothetical protein